MYRFFQVNFKIVYVSEKRSHFADTGKRDTKTGQKIRGSDVDISIKYRYFKNIVSYRCGKIKYRYFQYFLEVFQQPLSGCGFRFCIFGWFGIC